MKEYDNNKGCIDIEYKPTYCMECNKLLARTYLEKGDIGEEIGFHILCHDCYMRKFEP
jgi:hypothetical protein